MGFGLNIRKLACALILFSLFEKIKSRPPIGKLISYDFLADVDAHDGSSDKSMSINDKIGSQLGLSTFFPGIRYTRKSRDTRHIQLQEEGYDDQGLPGLFSARSMNRLCTVCHHIRRSFRCFQRYC